MRRPPNPFRRRRRNRIARSIEHVALRIMSAIWLVRLFIRHGLRYVR
jgi:hypothetical protein